MANPRAVVDFGEIGVLRATYKYDASIVYNSALAGGAAQVGKAVTLVGDSQVGLAGDGEFVEGKLILVESDGFCTVQVGGYMQFAGGNGASLTRGKAIVGAVDAGAVKGFIREVATGTAAELGRCRGSIVDASTASATWVRF